MEYLPETWKKCPAIRRLMDWLTVGDSLPCAERLTFVGTWMLSLLLLLKKLVLNQARIILYIYQTVWGKLCTVDLTLRINNFAYKQPTFTVPFSMF